MYNCLLCHFTDWTLYIDILYIVDIDAHKDSCEIRLKFSTL